jgi:hypothetical protein
LTKGSGVRINVGCDLCGKLNNIQYYNYNNCLKKQNLYVCEKCKSHKTKITNNKNYGCDWVLQNKDIQKTSKKTLLKKYGVDNISKLDKIKEDRKDNFKKESFKSKSKITMLKKYGVDNVSKSNLFKEKKIKTCLKNWGVNNPSQSVVIFDKSQKSGKKIKYDDKTKLYYRGTYELDFLNYCYNNGIYVTRGKTFKYKFNNTERYYHSDFYLPNYNLICEIKSDYYYNKYIEVNQKKRLSVIEMNYSFMFIINKDYESLNKLINI